MDDWQLPHALRRARTAKGLSMRALGATLDISHSTIADWEHARSYPSSFEVQRLAGALGVTICDLYGVEEGHRASATPETLRLAEELARAFQTPPERIEINVVPAGDWQLGESIETEDFRPTRGDRDTRVVLEQWAEMTEEQRQEWLSAGKAIRKERNEP